MVDKKVLEQKMAELMDVVPECEGLIAADTNGKVIIGQTLLEMDHDPIAKSCATIMKETNNFGKDIGKGSLQATTIELEKGYAVLVGSDTTILIALAGLDGKSSLSLLKRHLIAISKS
ncbi:MAG: roadblock/LC7 domain-containing protein [Candidatus Thorarchaeota archaeon]